MIPSDFSVLPFRFDNLQVRVVLVEGVPWFVAKDVAVVLGYARPRDAITQHCKYAKSLNDIDAVNHRPYTNQAVNLDPQIKLIPESDVYRLILRSHLPSAERFERWLMEEVLPSIRKTGAYHYGGDPWQGRPPFSQGKPDASSTTLHHFEQAMDHLGAALDHLGDSLEGIQTQHPVWPGRIHRIIRTVSTSATTTTFTTTVEFDSDTSFLPDTSTDSTTDIPATPMTDDELKALVASLAVAQAKTDAQMAETDRKLEKIGKMIGAFGRNLGEITEEFFFNSLKDNQNLGGIHYDIVYKNMTTSVNRVEDEFDIVMINGEDVAIIEVKYKAHEADLKKLLTSKYTNFKTLFPMYKDYRHHLVLASFSIYDELK